MQRSLPELLRQATFALAAAAALNMTAPQGLLPAADAALTSGDIVKNARALLRNALPIENKQIREIQRELESISEALRIPGKKSLGPVQRSVRRSADILKREQDKIIAVGTLNPGLLSSLCLSAPLLKPRGASRLKLPGLFLRTGLCRR